MANVATLVVCLMTIIALCYGQDDRLFRFRFDKYSEVFQKLSEMQTQINHIKEESGEGENADGRKQCLLDGWVPFEGKCYYFLTKKHFNHDAQLYCENYGGKLAEPTTRTANEFIKATVRKYKTNQWWIGLNDIQSEGTWVWTKSKKTPNYSDWKRGNPNQGRRANCGGLWHQYDYGWVDEPCNRAYNAICEL